VEPTYPEKSAFLVPDGDMIGDLVELVLFGPTRLIPRGAQYPPA
jgi:hypothetical protein